MWKVATRVQARGENQAAGPCLEGSSLLLVILVGMLALNYWPQ